MQPREVLTTTPTELPTASPETIPVTIPISTVQKVVRNIQYLIDKEFIPSKSRFDKSLSPQDLFQALITNFVKETSRKPWSQMTPIFLTETNTPAIPDWSWKKFADSPIWNNAVRDACDAELPFSLWVFIPEEVQTQIILQSRQS